MVGHHVTQRARFIVVAAALLHADGFGNRDLHVIYIAAVPDRLENAIGKSKCQDVLNGFFAEVVINAIDLILAGNLEKLLVQCLGRFEIVAEGFLHDYTAPISVLFFH